MSNSLRRYLQQIDGSAPAIQGAAGAMMKHYDKSSGVAVGEWRNALIQAHGHQYLPLLYVANEVLQTSKRNRGNKFLESFSPILGQSLIFVCSKSDPPMVDRIRRTVKIWADRRVFSIRYVNELLKGLEPYRKGNNNNNHRRPAQQSPQPSASFSDSEGPSSPGGSRFSPVHQEEHDRDASSEAAPTVTTEEGPNDENSEQSDDDDDDDDDDLFGTATKKLLKIDVDFDKAAKNLGKKRRRDEPQTTSTKSTKAKRRTSTQYLSASSLLELMNQVRSQQEQYDRLQTKLGGMRKLYSQNADASIESLVGNELLEAYKKLLKDEKETKALRKQLHAIAQKKRALETEAIRYLPWLERALQQDKDDIAFCQKFRKQLDLFRTVHGPTQTARNRRLREEALRAKKEEDRLARQKEEEERKKFAESAMSKQTEAKPGMVWNKATGEYQYPNQEESWRD